MALIIQSSTFWKTSFPSTTWEGETNVNPLSKVALGKETKCQSSFQSCTLERNFHVSLALL